MNKDQIKGTVKDLAGQAQEAVGKALDDKKMQAKGLYKQAEGSAEKAIGEAKQGVKDLKDAVKTQIKRP